MVKVEGLTEGEKALREKTSRLVEITKEALGVKTSQQIYSSPTGTIHVSHHSPETPGYPISVNPAMNTVFVESRPYFDEAVMLATAYEKATKEGFTVKELFER